MKQSVILGTALAMALSVAPAMAGNLEALKNANGTSMSTAELASVEGKRRNRSGIRVRNRAVVLQGNFCKKCALMIQGNISVIKQKASVKVYSPRRYRR